MIRNLKVKIATKIAGVMREKIIKRRNPDFVIGTSADPYLFRWWVIPRNPMFNIYLHVFMRSDTDEALHDHPWANMSYLLEGWYTEVSPKFPAQWPVNRDLEYKRRYAGDIVFRKATDAHRVLLARMKGHTKELPCMSLFFTGRNVRTWGFYCPQGWKTFTDFITTTKNGNERGKGCDE